MNLRITCLGLIMLVAYLVFFVAGIVGNLPTNGAYYG